MDVEKVEELVEKVLNEKPEIIISALRRKPEILRQVISEVIPSNVATKEDIKMLHEELKLIAEMFNRRFEDINRRFEDLIRYSDKRFEDMQRQMGKRFEMMFRIILGFNVPLLVSMIILLLKSFGVM